MGLDKSVNNEYKNRMVNVDCEYKAKIRKMCKKEKERDGIIVDIRMRQWSS